MRAILLVVRETRGFVIRLPVTNGDKMLKIFSSLGGLSNVKLGEAIGAADAARDARDWPEAALLYRKALDIDGSLAPIWVQYGHALKEAKNFKEAEAAYRQSLSIDDQVADTHLQLGHLLKILDRKGDAIESYKKAAQITPNDPMIQREIDACKKGLGTKFYQGGGSYHVYFDISDLIFYIGHHDNLTGIQRVQASIILALLNIDLENITIHFLTYVNSQRAFYEIDQSFAVSLINDLSIASATRQVQFDKNAARDGYIRDSVPLGEPTAKSNVVCVLGAAWVNRDYFLRIRNLKRRHGFHFMYLIHDLIPVYARDTCDQGTAEIFTNFLIQSHGVTDSYLCVSENTKKDLLRYFEDLGLHIADPKVTQNGTLLPPPTRAPKLGAIDLELATGNYILFVGTIEGRKNHMAAFRAFEKLLNERDNVPYLVCVGRLGWRAEEFLFACQDSEFLEGKIKILSDISDDELTALYQNCLLTIYPSLYEGWGLPVGESLGLGKICITSNVTSLPEVGGDFAHYIDPMQPGQLAQAISSYLDNPAAAGEAEARIRSNYHAIAWTDVASKIIQACVATLEAPVRPVLPVLELGREYPIALPPRLPANLMGERMVEAITFARKRRLTPGLYRDSDYLTGQDARSGEGWCAPEADFTWARIKGAELGFSLSNPCEAPLVMYVLYQASAPCLGASLIVESSRGQPQSHEIKYERGHLVVQGLRPLHSSGIARYLIRLSVVGFEDLEERLRALDGRCPAFAIRCFVVISEADVAARLNILEKLSSV